jgi:1,4-dihydroxy-2-naphthoyl-CoA hydrolase
MTLSKDYILEKANLATKNTLMETLSIEFVDAGSDYIVARMPVTSKVHQPDGVLHGGATAALAETVGSFAAHVFLDVSSFYVRGIDISAQHVKSVSSGYVYAKAQCIHNGRTTQVFDIKVTNDDQKLVSICKLTTITLPKS